MAIDPKTTISLLVLMGLSEEKANELSTERAVERATKRLASHGIPKGMNDDQKELVRELGFELPPETTEDLVQGAAQEAIQEDKAPEAPTEPPAAPKEPESTKKYPPAKDGKVRRKFRKASPEGQDGRVRLMTKQEFDAVNSNIKSDRKWEKADDSDIITDGDGVGTTGFDEEVSEQTEQAPGAPDEEQTTDTADTQDDSEETTTGGETENDVKKTKKSAKSTTKDGGKKNKSRKLAKVIQTAKKIEPKTKDGKRSKPKHKIGFAAEFFRKVFEKNTGITRDDLIAKAVKVKISLGTIQSYLAWAQRDVQGTPDHANPFPFVIKKYDGNMGAKCFKVEKRFPAAVKEKKVKKVKFIPKSKRRKGK